ncbi:MAG: hypothetical protein AAF571_04630 [Verrucomicrobiota bacterium]
MQAKLKWGLTCFCVCLLIGGTLFFYPRIKTQLLIARALKLWEQQNFPEAERWAYRAHLSDPNHVKALGMLGDSLQLRDSPAAIYYKRQVAQKLPHIDDAWLDVARCALNLGYTQAAADALTHVQQHQRADYHNLKGAVHLQKNDTKEALKHFAAALAAGGTNRDRFNWAAAGLITSDGILNPQALNTLMELQQLDRFQLDASRMLALGYIASDSSEQSIPHLWVLLRHGSMSDQHFALSQLLSSGKAPPEILDQIDTPQVRLYLSAWLRDQQQPNRALEMLAPAMNSDHPGIIFSYAEMLNQVGQSEQALTALENHQGIIPDLLRWKFLSSPTNQLPILATLHPYLNNRAKLQIALEMLSSWGRSDAVVEVYSELVKEPGERGSRDYLDALDYLLEQDNILAAYQLSQRRYSVSESIISGNNFAYLALILDLATEQAESVAEKLYSRHPEVPQIKTTQRWYQLRKNETGLIPEDIEFITEQLGEDIPRFTEEKNFIRKYLSLVAKSEISPQSD